MSEARRFEGRTIMVTGAAGNIGLTTALRFAEEGANVALVDIKQDELDSATSKVSAHGVTAKGYACDVTDPAAVRETVERIAGDFGRIDLLFNNAGYQGLFQPAHKYPEDDFATVTDINVNGMFYVLKAVGAHMAAAGGGAIVNTASMAGVGGPPNMVAYAASKFAVVGVTQVAAKDLAPHNIRVNAISPAYMGPGYMWDRQVNLQAEAGSQYYSSDPKKVAEEMISAVPMRRVGSIEEIPGAVAFLLSDDASYITGVNIPISGGIL